MRVRDALTGPTLALLLAAVAAPASGQAASRHAVAPLLPPGMVETLPGPFGAGPAVMGPWDRLAWPVAPDAAPPGSAGRGAGPMFTVALDEPVEVDNVSAVVVSPDGGRVVSAGFLTDVVSAVTPDGARLWSYHEPGCGPYDVDDRGGIVAVACIQNDRLLVLDAVQGTLLHRVSASSSVAQVQLTADGAHVFAGVWAPAADAEVLVVSTATGAVERTLDVPVCGSGFTYRYTSNRDRFFFCPMAVSDAGQTLAHADFTGVRIYGASASTPVHSVSASWIPDVLEVSPDGATVLAVYTYPFVRAVFYDAASGEATPVPLSGAVLQQATGALAPDGQSALVALGGVAQFIAPGQAPVPLPGPAVLVQPLGQGRAAVLSDDSARLVDLASRAVLATRPAVAVRWPGRARDGATPVGTATFEDVVLQTLTADAGPVRLDPGAAPEPDGARFGALDAAGARLAVSNALSESVQMIDVETFATLWRTPVGAPAAGVAVLPSGHVAVAAGARLLLLDGETGAVLDAETLAGNDPRRVVAVGARVFAEVQGDTHIGTTDVFDAAVDGLSLVGRFETYTRTGTNVGLQTIPHTGVTPNGATVIGTDFETASVRVFDVGTGTLTVVPVGGEGQTVGVSDDSKQALVLDQTDRVHLISLVGVPSLTVSTVVPDLQGFAVVFDASESGFWVVAGTPPSPTRLVLIDAGTGAIRETRTLDGEFFVGALFWSPRTGLAVAGQGVLRWYPGSARSLGMEGVLVTERGVLDLGNPPAQIVGPTAFGEVIALVPGPDVLAVAAGTPVATDAGPAASGLRLRAVGSPARGAVQVRLDGPAQADVRVEVVDLLGRVVARLHDGPFGGGSRTLAWRTGTAGTYVVRVAGTGVATSAVVVR